MSYLIVLSIQFINSFVIEFNKFLWLIFMRLFCPEPAFATKESIHVIQEENWITEDQRKIAGALKHRLDPQCNRDHRW